MDEPATTFERLIAERTRPDQYRELLINATFGPEIERALAVLVQLWIKKQQVHADYLRRGRRPGGELQSARWREADAGLYGSAQTLAALLGSMYPSPDGNPPVQATIELAQHRAAALSSSKETSKEGTP
jgi:hypothetical protein